MIKSINELWHNGTEQDWQKAENYYYNLVKPQNIEVEKKFENLNSKQIKNMTTNEFYEFLYNEYFVWKYTAPNRLKTTRNALCKYKTENRIKDLEEIKELIFNSDLNNVSNCLKVAQNIHGLGIAGASGLLAVLFPKHFGTVDQFAIKALLKIENLQEHEIISKMNPDCISLKNGVVLINIMKKKANELNTHFNTNFWTPRKIDKILWIAER